MSFLSRHRRRAAARNASKALDEVSALALNVGLKSAAFIAVARQPGRVFSAKEIDAAADVATKGLIQNFHDKCSADGLPQEITDTMSALFIKRCKSEIRRGLYAGLPADALEIQGAG